MISIKEGTIILSQETLDEIRIARQQESFKVIPRDAYHPATLALVELADLVGIPKTIKGK
jgi:hypothetical protein